MNNHRTCLKSFTFEALLWCRVRICDGGPALRAGGLHCGRCVVQPVIPPASPPAIKYNKIPAYPLSALSICSRHMCRAGLGWCIVCWAAQDRVGLYF